MCIRDSCYDHAVATYALCEAYTFCKQMDIPSISNLEKVVVKAVDRIIDAQCPNGGWGYSYNNKINPDIDLSAVSYTHLAPERQAPAFQSFPPVFP